MSKLTRILSITGGGVRGLIAARCSQELEKRTGKNITELFDVVVGTSIGGITALLLTAPQSPGSKKPLYQSVDVINLLLQKSPEIFYRSSARKIKTLNGLIGAKYDRTSLNSILLDRFHDLKLSNALIPTNIPFFDLSTRQPITASSFHAQKKLSHDFFARDIAAATSAAPTYFDPYTLWNTEKTTKFTGVDGGLYSNNPELIGLGNAYHIDCISKKILQSSNECINTDNILMASLGTGTLTPPTDHTILNSGVLGWMKGGEILHDVFDSTEIESSKISKMLLPKGQYFHLQPFIPESAHALDDASSANLQKILAIAESYIKDSSKTFDDLAAKLVQ